MIRIVFKTTSPWLFREWDIVDGKIIRCDPDPEVSWVGVDVPLEEKDLFAKQSCLKIAWADGTYEPLDFERMIRLPNGTAPFAAPPGRNRRKYARS
jgi:hypothetical protein